MMNDQMTNAPPSREPIYHEACLTASDSPAQTLYNCRCMLSMLRTKKLEGDEITGEAAVGVGLIFHQVQLALRDITERYDFVENSGSVSVLG